MPLQIQNSITKKTVSKFAYRLFLYSTVSFEYRARNTVYKDIFGGVQTQSSLVELKGLEPSAYALRTHRSTN